MAKVKENEFTTYDLTGEEEVQGAILNTLQMYVIQNQIFALRMQKDNLEVPNGVDDKVAWRDFLTQHAELTGQIKALNYMLECHHAAQSALIDMRKNPSPEL